jgi:sirohydrochlorin cobaltochelatase
MKKRIFILLSLLLVFCLANINAKGSKMKNTKAILIASFGTSHEDTRKKTIEACEKMIKKSFKNYEVRRAFTSNIIRKILKEEQNLNVDSVEGALKKLQDDGFTDIIIQPLHIINGEEYHEKIVMAAAKYKKNFESIKVGRPILSNIYDYDRAIEALKKDMPKLKNGQGLVLMGHGTHHPANAAYACFQMKLYKSIPNVFVGTVEGYPELDDVITQLEKNNIKEVILMPFMIVAGDHAKNDMAGSESDSWKSILTKKGFKVSVILKGLGENKYLQKMYVSNIKDVINGNPSGL